MQKFIGSVQDDGNTAMDHRSNGVAVSGKRNADAVSCHHPVLI